MSCLSLIQVGTTSQVLDTNYNGHYYLVCELTHIMANASPVDNNVSISVEQRSRLGLIYCTILIITAEIAIATTKATKRNEQPTQEIMINWLFQSALFSKQTANNLTTTVSRYMLIKFNLFCLHWCCSPLTVQAASA